MEPPRRPKFYTFFNALCYSVSLEILSLFYLLDLYLKMLIILFWFVIFVWASILIVNSSLLYPHSPQACLCLASPVHNSDTGLISVARSSCLLGIEQCQPPKSEKTCTRFLMFFSGSSLLPPQVLLFLHCRSTAQVCYHFWVNDGTASVSVHKLGESPVIGPGLTWKTLPRHTMHEECSISILLWKLSSSSILPGPSSVPGKTSALASTKTCGISLHSQSKEIGILFLSIIICIFLTL